MQFHVPVLNVWLHVVFVGAVSQAILAAAGPGLVEECTRFGECCTIHLDTDTLTLGGFIRGTTTGQTVLAFCGIFISLDRSAETEVKNR